MLRIDLFRLIDTVVEELLIAVAVGESVGVLAPTRGL